MRTEFEEDVVIVGGGPLAYRIAAELEGSRDVLVLSDSNNIANGESRHAQRMIHRGYAYCRLKSNSPVLWVRELCNASVLWQSSNHEISPLAWPESGFVFAFRRRATYGEFKSAWKLCELPEPYPVGAETFAELVHETSDFKGGIWDTQEVPRSQALMIDGLSLHEHRLSARFTCIRSCEILQEGQSTQGTANLSVTLQNNSTVGIRARHVIWASGRRNFEASCGHESRMKLAAVRPEGLLLVRCKSQNLPRLNACFPDLPVAVNGINKDFGIYLVSHVSHDGICTWSVTSSWLSPDFPKVPSLSLEDRLTVVRDAIVRLFRLNVEDLSWDYLIRGLANPDGLTVEYSDRCIMRSPMETRCHSERLTLVPLIAREVASSLNLGATKTPDMNKLPADFIDDQEISACEISASTMRNWSELGGTIRSEVEAYRSLTNTF